MIDRIKIAQKHEAVPPDYYEKGIAENRWQRIWHSRRFREVLKLIPTSRPIDCYLDIGCDGGLLMQAVAKKMNPREAFGVDIAKESIAYAQKKYPHFHFQVADGHLLPFSDNHFDFITCFEVLEHVTEPRLMLREIKRCLTKGGELVILVPSESLLFTIIWFFWTKFGRGRAWQKTHINQIDPEELEPFLQNLGFEIIKTQESHFGMLKAVCAKLADKNL